ncbi:MAG: 23S rRNA (adenine(2503)-C(2))-methyltransferase RlmN [Bacteroidales bacterium]
METTKQDILSLTLPELQKICVEHGEKAFRAKQIYNWIWVNRVRSFEEMTNISQSLRTFLTNSFYFKTVTVHSTQKSKDGTIKIAFELDDNHIIEGVLIPSGKRITACISSQVGCGLGCSFCATASLGFCRNLSVGEITDQLFAIDALSVETYSQTVTNIVYMGMGEPLLNYDAVIKSVRQLTDKNGTGIAPSRITLSTVGLTDGIRALADDSVACNLAVSIHFPDNKRRSAYMPVNAKNNLEDLSDALTYYYAQTNKRISIEYTLLQGINDSVDDASKLAEFTRQFPVKINIIEYNPHANSEFKPSDSQTRDKFVSFLEKLNLIVTVRYSKGKDIDAACGQLAQKNI